MFQTITCDELEQMMQHLANARHAERAEFPAALNCSPAIYYVLLAMLEGRRDDGQYAAVLLQKNYVPIYKPVYRTQFGDLYIRKSSRVIGMQIDNMYCVEYRDTDGMQMDVGTYEGRNLNDIERIILDKAQKHYAENYVIPKYIVLSEYPYITLKQILHLKVYGSGGMFHSASDITQYPTPWGIVQLIHLTIRDRNIIEVG